MSNLQAEEYKNFEEIKKIKEDGTEYWNARELSEVLQYKKWENFAKVIDRAKLACQNSGFEIDDHFPEVRKMVEIGSNTTREVLDYELSRYAGYMDLYGGLTVDDIHARKKLKDNEKILDFMGSTELIANHMYNTEKKSKS